MILQSSVHSLSSVPTYDSQPPLLLLVPWKLLVNVYSHGCISTQTLIGNKPAAAVEDAHCQEVQRALQARGGRM